VGSSEFLKLFQQTNVPRQYIANKIQINEIEAKRVKFDEDIISPRLVLDELQPLPPTPILPQRSQVAPVPIHQRLPVTDRVLKR
jgi:hypothetical protein